MAEEVFEVTGRNPKIDTAIELAGFADDLKICAAVDSVPVLPVQIENKIKLKKEEPPIIPV